MRQTTQPKTPAWENKASEPLAIKSMGVMAAEEIASLTRKACWRGTMGT